MKLKIIFGAAFLVFRISAAEVPSPNSQIAAALLAAPVDLRSNAAVLGYNARGELVKLRDGKNELICIANEPGKSAFTVACYHRDLEPYMARGRELLAKKVPLQERYEIRWKEIADGKLRMSREPRTLYVLTGESFDSGTGIVTKPYLRWGIYVPFATLQSTGLSATPRENAPWLMFAGTAGAHIMINPQKTDHRATAQSSEP